MRSNLRKAIRLTKLATREISQILRVDEKTVNVIRDALNDDVINEIQALRQASADEMESWIAELGFDVLRVLFPTNPYRNVGKPNKREFLPQIQTSRQLNENARQVNFSDFQFRASP